MVDKSIYFDISDIILLIECKGQNERIENIYKEFLEI